MASPTSSEGGLGRRLLEAHQEAGWRTADDIARISFESMVQPSQLGRTLLSEGSLRLAGDGVRGAAAPIDAVGRVMTLLQRLVTASGAAREDHKSARGPLPKTIVDRTTLNLRASPVPGSVVLRFLPAANPADELTPGGAVPAFDVPTTQLADYAVEDVLEMIESSLEPDDARQGETFLDLVSAHGPRFASALRDFSRTMGDCKFDADFRWAKPGAPTLRVSLSASDARRLADEIAGRELDAEEVEITGILHTISDLSNLVVELADGQFQAVDGKNLSATEMRAATLHAKVRLTTSMTTEIRPGGVEVTRFVASRMDVLDAE